MSKKGESLFEFTRFQPIDGTKKELICFYVDCLIDKLISDGYAIQRYDAFSSNSVYLKIDYGVCGTIRISDHNSHKKDLKYRYNVNISEKAERRILKDRKYYGDAYRAFYKLLSDIRKRRKSMLSRYGGKRYDEFMHKNYETGIRTRGFWQESKIIWK